jgi:hypothetical protein
MTKEQVHNAKVLKERDLTGCGKTHPGLPEVSGHDFSRAVND